MRFIRSLLLGAVFVVALWAVIPRGNPGGVSDAKYSKFKGVPAPKVLYSCTRKPTRESFSQEARACRKSGRVGCEEKVDELVEAGTETEVDFVAGQRRSTYDELVQEARRKCAQNVGSMEPGEFKVLEADKS